MTVIGFHNSHEQIHPAQLLRDVQHAEQVGFTAAMCSDHLIPWSERQGQSGFAWSWLGAALATTGLPFGAVNAPGQRYHPVIIAQAIATLGAMFPGRFWAALGSGEAMNEHVTGDRWPTKEEGDEAAFAVAHDQWRSNLLPPSVNWHLETPEQFDAVADLVRPEEVRGTVLVEHDARRLADRVAEMAACGFDEVYL